MTAQSNGFIFYRGPSMLDGQPIIAVATGIARGSRNGKTGSEVQTWILRDDMSPVDAVKRGADASICGNCVHRGDGMGGARSCYVTVFQAPLVVWKAAQRGIYPEVSPEAAAASMTGKVLRLGSYGDPAAVPVAVWRALVSEVSGHTGYTHQWRISDDLRDLCMASCDSAFEQELAAAQGWRTFRVRTAAEPLATREIICPASKEAGAKTSCSACKACGGISAKARVNIAIIAHGAASKVNAFNARN
ncbi:MULTISPECIES: hypothetical protein [unclassified Bradyrhizobium]|uniref:hypothetical protein n=1 Tax=unclassified Bradyrhizobium TaxID=2631580 RepID=UPI00291641A8|nr:MULTISPECIES: hypothetical protein [unclassified Bradyrhizobium]